MAAIVWTDVTADGTLLALASLPAVEQTQILGTVNRMLNVRVWGGEEHPKLKSARIFLARHIAELMRRSLAGSGSAGMVSSETISSTSFAIDYESLATEQSTLRSTTWGAQYLVLSGTNPKARIPGAL